MSVVFVWNAAALTAACSLCRQGGAVPECADPGGGAVLQVSLASARGVLQPVTDARRTGQSLTDSSEERNANR